MYRYLQILLFLQIIFLLNYNIVTWVFFLKKKEQNIAEKYYTWCKSQIFFYINLVVDNRLNYQ